MMRVRLLPRRSETSAKKDAQETGAMSSFALQLSQVAFPSSPSLSTDASTVCEKYADCGLLKMGDRTETCPNTAQMGVCRAGGLGIAQDVTLKLSQVHILPLTLIVNGL